MQGELEGQVEISAGDAVLLSRRLPPDPGLVLPEIALDHAGRQRTRLRIEVDGRCYAVLLHPGLPLGDGELLADDLKPHLRVRAAAEPVAVVRTTDPRLLARAAWHLGNRHVPVAIEADCLFLQPDHVLEDLLRGLGLDVHAEQRPFNPEPGAYHGGHHAGRSGEGQGVHAQAPFRAARRHDH